ncbi:MAG TPA: DUF5335 family protein [Chroococcales cyanobacterium]|jgi:hypothetical protein
MGTREIPQAQWHEYLDTVNKRMGSRFVTVESEGELGNQVLAEHAPLIGIEPEEKGSMKCAIDVQLGGKESPSSRTVHPIRCPNRLMVKEDALGEPEAIDIEGEEPGDRTRIKMVIRFEASSK